ncbi:hypothetical protein [uncultured Umboniibacter sp.]|uniref:hypothetical protein n=1 Tax=uncultured Umboniibacter sp. TaxID=1798917 RepID=UPI0026234B64|nr:hypothetical protein [uncultured Umboniibacter sp.]
MKINIDPQSIRAHRQRLLSAATNGDWQMLRQVDLEIRILLAELRQRRFKSDEISRALKYLERAHETAMLLAREQRDLLQKSLAQSHDLSGRAQAYGQVIRANFGTK